MFTLRVLLLSLVILLNYFQCHGAVTRKLRIENKIKQRASESESPACQIYCYGPLLHTVQMANIFEDSKTFVDMKLRNPPDETMANFLAFMESKNDKPTESDLRDFVNAHFDDVSKEFMPWEPADWIAHPNFTKQIKDPELKQWGLDLNQIWKDLGRKMIDDVHTNSDLYSIIPVDNAVVVPGGRYREFYYWDSYWIVRGLLYSEMYQTVRGMLENFKSVFLRYGYIQNGGRIYYKRSQLPLLAGMVKSYVDFSKDELFGKDSIDVLEQEFEFFMKNRSVQVKGYDLYAYGDSASGPRPESYREDVETAKIYATEEEREAQYAELRAAAESGMDFGSRWFINSEGTNTGNLTNLKTRYIVPVDLNAVLYWNAKIIAEFHTKAGQTAKATEYENKAAKIQEAIDNILWNEEVGAWLDYDMINNKPRNYFSPTNLSPLWVKAFNVTDSEQISARVLKYIDELELDKYPGGVPNSLLNTGEQWDFPNVWPHMSYILIEGLDNLGTEAAKNLSTKWGHRWVKSNYKGYSETHIMFEKYNAETFGGHGGGGEYDVQKGFGWTNGVIVEFLAKYGQEITVMNGSTSSTESTVKVFGLIAVSILVAILGRV